ncbi:1-(5-phosphoribosyl)-5-[(5-phosphoribosylamino)methylideneamino] imidazole-4-carboxamide isomerase [Allosphingosinicella sp.]|uniref:1-(5-phosphoribosyl)-5-[(5- phosphoribosylamino)methylideneamino] imidazole-4-carboxamide isomerase n=1 Tax=Allosphingosinicella sp. TaxID=2823234 RepID=UPI00378432D6
MIVYPAMDLLGGRCVRLAQGRFEAVTRYLTDPADALAGFAASGASWAHVVDLDGARDRSPRQHELIAQLARNAGLQLQVAGGFRERAHLELMFEAGVGRVVIGSLAVQQPQTVRGFIADYGGDRITLALDVNMVDGVPMVATAGWAETSGLTLWQVTELYPEAQHLLVTDISRDGMMSGPNLPLLTEAVERLPHLAIQASGGIASLHDLPTLPTAGVIIGKALWEQKFTLAEAISVAGR